VLWAIASRTDENGYAFPGYARLSRDTRLPIRTVERAIKEIPPNELVIVRKGGSEKGKKRQSATYRVEISRPENPKPDDHGRGVGGSNRKINVNNSPTTDNSAPHHRRNVGRTTDVVSIEPPTWCRPNSHKQSVEQSASPSDLSVAKKEKTEELPPKAAPTPTPTPSETKEQLIERLTQEFSAVNVLEAAQKYEQHCKDNGKEWIGRKFVSIVTEIHNKQKREAKRACSHKPFR
jgi:hypothetical protein